jgi:hypothetical protein
LSDPWAQGKFRRMEDNEKDVKEVGIERSLYFPEQHGEVGFSDTLTLLRYSPWRYQVECPPAALL